MKIELWNYSCRGTLDNWGTIRGFLGTIGNNWGLLETIGSYWKPLGTSGELVGDYFEESIVSRRVKVHLWGVFVTK